MVQRHILLVDDDDDVRASLRRPLQGEGYVISEAASLAAAHEQIARPGQRFDVILLDLGLPDGDGRGLCSSFRAEGINVPIIVLTGFGEEDDVVSALDSGANDYVLKPFRISELLARLRAQMRVHDISEDAEMAVGSFRFRPSDRLLVAADGTRVRLTGKEAAVLKYLLRAGCAVSRNELLRQVWGYNATATTHTVETHIYRLRQKLDGDGSGLRMLLNEGGGYRLYPEGQSPDDTPLRQAG